MFYLFVESFIHILKIYGKLFKIITYILVPILDIGFVVLFPVFNQYNTFEEKDRWIRMKRTLHYIDCLVLVFLFVMCTYKLESLH